jgi:murein hydrolase activator
LIIKYLIPFLVFSATASAAVENHVDKLVKDFEGTKKSLVAEEVKQRKIMSSLFEINRKMKKIVGERGDLVQERMLLEDNTRDLAQKIAILDEKVKTQKVFLRERLSVIYRFGGLGAARMIFSSSSSSQLERNLKILGVVAKRDLDRIKDYSSSVEELEKKRLKLDQRLTHLKKIEGNIRKKEEKLTYENDYKNRILNGIRNSKKFALMKLSGLREKTAQMAMNDESGVLDLLFRPSFFEQKGQLPTPLSGKIVQEFGLVHNEEHNVTLSHKGVFFSAAPGSLVRSVFGGKVAFVGPIPGFGKTVVVDHGDHYYTVYSHNQIVAVQEGQEIDQSQTLATSGSTSEQFGAGLYFEVRHFSEPYDPRLWMKGSL